MKTAQDYLKETTSGEVRGGFNSRLQGLSFLQCVEGVPQSSRWGELSAGWHAADKMISEGEIYSEMFPTPKNQQPTWQIALCKMDGDAWFCCGEGFEDLQISDNYTFGETRELAMSAYADLMRPKGPSE